MAMMAGGIRRRRARQTVRRMVTGAAALAVAACGAADRAAGAPEAVVRDSAGITIVENVVADSSAWRWWPVRSVPEVEIGTVDGEGPTSLHRVVGVVRLSDGRVAVANGGSSEIRLFDAAGGHVGTLGRAGGGPGEFQALTALLRGPGDSLLAWDVRLRRVTVFGPDGGYARDLQLMADGTPLTLVGTLAGGRLLGSQSIFDNVTEASSGLQRPPLAVAAFDAAGVRTTEFGRHPGEERTIRIGDGIIQIGLPPFARRTQVAGNGDQVIVATQDRGELLVYGLDGGLTRIVRTGVTPGPVTDADLAAHITRVTADMAPDQQAVVRGGLEAMPRVASRPAHGPLVVADNGDIWLSDFPDPATQHADWTVFDADGVAVARVRLPEGFRLFAVEGDRLVGVARDALDVEYVRVYRLDGGR